MPPPSNDRPKKLQRISQACDLCHRRSIRCRPSAENSQQQCQNCYDFAVDCTYNRPSRRRRNPSLAQSTPPNILPLQQGNQVLSPASDDDKDNVRSSIAATNSAGGAADYTGAYNSIREGCQEDVLEVAWRSFALASLATIDEHLSVYMDYVYPIYPLFHGPTLWERIRKRHHLTDRGFFASIMAACALAAARVRDGAVGDRYRLIEQPEKSSEIFFAAAQDAICKDLRRAQCLDYMRACALLAITAIQYGQIKTVHQYLGTYGTISAMQSFHDESHWPQDLTPIEREERRRLFWSMYNLDIYCSVVFDAVMKSNETHSNVRYPSEVNDEELTAGIQSPANDENWLRGWNFTTDLYRVLEHSVKRMRRNQPVRDDRIAITRLLIADGIPEMQVMENVYGLFQQLPARFQSYNARLTGDRSLDFVGFQAANIQATLQLVRMTLFSSHFSQDVNQKCVVAQDALTVFHSIAPQYLRAMSTPVVYQLGGIGQILGSVMEGLLCEESYKRVRKLLVSMADLLQNLESNLQPTAGASRDLRKQIEKIDRYMDAQRQLISSYSQQQRPHAMTDGLSNGMPNGMPNGMMQHSQQQPMMQGLGVQTPLEEFQLPPDLVQNGAWPWPFDFTGQDTQMPMMMGFE